MHTYTRCVINQIWVIYYKINRKLLDSQQSLQHCLENFPNLIYDASLQRSQPHPCRHHSLLRGRDFSPLSRNKETIFSVILYHTASSVHKKPVLCETGLDCLRWHLFSQEKYIMSSFLPSLTLVQMSMTALHVLTVNVSSYDSPILHHEPFGSQGHILFIFVPHWLSRKLNGIGQVVNKSINKSIN